MSWFDVLKFEYGKEISHFQDIADRIGFPASTNHYDQVPKEVPLYGGRNTSSCEFDDAEIVNSAVELWKGLSADFQEKFTQGQQQPHLIEAFNFYKKMVTSPVISGWKIWIAAPNQIAMCGTKNGHHQKPYKIISKAKAMAIWTQALDRIQDTTIATSEIKTLLIEESQRLTSMKELEEAANKPPFGAKHTLSKPEWLKDPDDADE